MFSTINETKTPSELVEWLRLWANGYEDGDALDDNDARQIADAVERVCAPCNAAALREALLSIKELNDRRPHDAAGYEINDIIEEALAAPARNCDRCEFWEDLWALEFVKLWPDVTDDLQRAWLFVRWLFKKAKQEGGAE